MARSLSVAFGLLHGQVTSAQVPADASAFVQTNALAETHWQSGSWWAAPKAQPAVEAKAAVVAKANASQAQNTLKTQATVGFGLGQKSQAKAQAPMMVNMETHDANVKQMATFKDKNYGLRAYRWKTKDTSGRVRRVDFNEPTEAPPPVFYMPGETVEIMVPPTVRSAWETPVDGAWSACQIKGRGQRPNTWDVMVPGAPKEFQQLNSIPSAALRRSFKASASATNMFLTRGFQENAWDKLKNIIDTAPAFNCTSYPMLCKAPFNCQSFSERERLSWFYYGAAARGQANLRMFCAFPEYGNYGYQCLAKKDPVGAAETRYQDLVANKYGRDQVLNDASQCFIEGHCNNKEVNTKTTIAEMEKMCDDRYTSERWNNAFSLLTLPADKPYYNGNAHRGYTGLDQTTPWTIMSCAMGKYHCDVNFCKQEICNKSAYTTRYSRYAIEWGWSPL